MNTENYAHYTAATGRHRFRVRPQDRVSRNTALQSGLGWPVGTVTEIHCSQPEGQAMGLVIPALAQLSLENRWIAWVAPPFVPYAPTLAAAGVDLSRVLVIHPRGSADSICAVEQALRSGNCGAVLGWLAGTKGVAPKTALQRLRLAAEQGNSRGILFRTAVADQAVSSTVQHFGAEPRSCHSSVSQQLEIGLN